MEVAGIEPEALCAKNPVSMQDSEFSVEALTEILTEISGTDRQMLTQIVQRWGSLSGELKRVPLTVILQKLWVGWVQNLETIWLEWCHTTIALVLLTWLMRDKYHGNEYLFHWASSCLNLIEIVNKSHEFSVTSFIIISYLYIWFTGKSYSYFKW